MLKIPPFGGTTTSKMHRVILHQTMEEAVKAGLLQSNPCKYLVLPQTERHQAQFYTAEQLQRLFDAIKEEPLYPLVKITAIYGLRRSELLGLKWDSIDFDVGMLTIKHTVSKVTKAVAKDKTKNTSSFRSFPLTDEARQIFKTAKNEEAQNRMLFGKSYQENEYVFKWPDGHPYSPDYVTDKFASLLKKNGLPHIRFHELRHSCASILINQGATLKDVQDWLGHRNIRVTADTYSHVDVNRKQGIANMMANQVRG